MEEFVKLLATGRSCVFQSIRRGSDVFRGTESPQFDHAIVHGLLLTQQKMAKRGQSIFAQSECKALKT
jgi:hypothetical protein